VSADSEASAKDVAKIIRRIKVEKIAAVLLENVTDHQLLDQIAKETGAERSIRIPSRRRMGQRRLISTCSATTSRR
jgi:zinc/manganese transport system substrate-binding protein